MAHDHRRLCGYLDGTDHVDCRVLLPTDTAQSSGKEGRAALLSAFQQGSECSGSGCGLRSGARLGVDPGSDLQRAWKLSAIVFSFHNLLYKLMRDVCELLVTVTAVLKKG